jgi:hypothetical protein
MLEMEARDKFEGSGSGYRVSVFAMQSTTYRVLSAERAPKPTPLTPAPITTSRGLLSDSLAQEAQFLLKNIDAH